MRLCMCVSFMFVGVFFLHTVERSNLLADTKHCKTGMDAAVLRKKRRFAIEVWQNTDGACNGPQMTVSGSKNIGGVPPVKKTSSSQDGGSA